MSVYGFTARSISGQETPLSNFRGKALLIVNVASQCGFTPQYKGLEALYQKYQERGFAVLGFPCNQFGSQEPGSEAEIQGFCQLNFGVTFPLFSKDRREWGSGPSLVRLFKRPVAGCFGQ
jgi:glutathione peroxidase